jgi:hypothetical protein
VSGNGERASEVRGKLFSEEDDAVGVGAFGVVLDAPAVSGLGEFLVVDEDEFGIQAGCNAAGEDGFFEFDFAAADFADFKGDVSTGFEDATEFVEGAGHDGLPVLELARGGELDGVGINAEEPAAEPIVAGVINDVEERRRGDDEGYGVAGDFGGGIRKLGEELGLGADFGEGVAVFVGAVGEELLGFFENDFGDVAARRNLVAVGVDFLLRLERDGLVRWQRVDGKETGGMAGEAVERDHADPGVDGIESVLLALDEQVFFEGADFLEGFGVVEDEEVFGEFRGVLQIDLSESGGNLVESGGIQARGCQDGAQWVDIGTDRDAASEGGFDGGGAAPHKGIIDNVAGLGESIDKEARKLGFKAGAIGDFVQAVGSPLLGSPEFVDVSGDLGLGVAGLESGLDEAGILAKFAEVSELRLKRGLPELFRGIRGEKGQFDGFAGHGFRLYLLPVSKAALGRVGKPVFKRVVGRVFGAKIVKNRACKGVNPCLRSPLFFRGRRKRRAA